MNEQTSFEIVVLSEVLPLSATKTLDCFSFLWGVTFLYETLNFFGLFSFSWKFDLNKSCLAFRIEMLTRFLNCLYVCQFTKFFNFLAFCRPLSRSLIMVLKSRVNLGQSLPHTIFSIIGMRLFTTRKIVSLKIFEAVLMSLLLETGDQSVLRRSFFKLHFIVVCKISYCYFTRLEPLQFILRIAPVRSWSLVEFP